MKRQISITLMIMFIIAGLYSIPSANSLTVTMQVPSLYFGPPPFTGKTVDIQILASEAINNIIAADLYLTFDPIKHVVAKSVTMGPDFFAAGWSPTINKPTDGSGVSVSMSGANQVAIGTSAKLLMTLTFDSHADATTATVHVTEDPIPGRTTGVSRDAPDYDDIPATVAPADWALPVQLSVLTATSTDRGVVIQWRTESELNNLGYDVYRSENPEGQFVKVNPAYIKGAGTDATPHDYQFVDESAVVGKTYYYYLETISFSGERERSHTIKVIIDISGKVSVTGLMQPTAFALLQNFPNPFNPETWIPFRLAKDADVTIRVFNLRGQEVRTIHLGQMPAGWYDTRGKAVLWDGRDSYGQEVSSGIYFYSLTAGNFHATKKLTIIK
jgi:hypothetical protein